MPIYVFEAPNGKRIQRIFPIGKAPRKVGVYERIITGFPVVNFAGGKEAGWTTPKPEHKVTWGDVEKHLKHMKIARKEKREQDHKRVKAIVSDYL